MAEKSAREIAAWLDGEHVARRPFTTISGLAAGGLAFAYDVQDALVALRRERTGAQVAGHKIGLTTRRMQTMCGLDHPIAGSILSTDVTKSPARLEKSSYIGLGLECEIAVRFGSLLGDAPSRAEIAAALDGVATAFEIIEDRAADYAKLDMPSLVADNSWNAGVVLGPVVKPHDLANMVGHLSIDGEPTDTGSSNDVLGHPLNAVEWLCAHLAARGRHIGTGEWVMTGSIVPTRFPKRGARFEFSLGDLPPVAATIS